jgi:MoxR-like ATPase
MTFAPQAAEEGKMPPKATPEIKNDDWAFEELQEEAEALRKKLDRFRTSLGRFLIGKQSLIDLMVVAAVAGEPLLLVGPPGTAKSDLVLKFKDALGLRDEDYFEYMLTRFTEPSEIIGPIDISELKGGSYIRRIEGKLPTCKLAFLDEIFKSNSAILNILLTIINERKFYQDGIPTPVPLRVLFAATNEIPEQAELAALKDRF